MIGVTVALLTSLSETIPVPLPLSATTRDLFAAGWTLILGQICSSWCPAVFTRVSCGVLRFSDKWITSRCVINFSFFKVLQLNKKESNNVNSRSNLFILVSCGFQGYRPKSRFGRHAWLGWEGGRRGVVVTRLIRSAKLLYAGPG